ncbi:MAG: Cna B-type domain-containing protein [Oscillospiraceae bacterium]
MQNKKRFSVRALVAICLSVCVMFISAFPAMAASDDVEVAEPDTMIKLHCMDGQNPISGFEWSIYRVAGWGAGYYVPSGDFADAQIDMSNLKEEDMQTCANSFESYAVANQIAPLSTQTIDEQGEALFPVEETGLYLLIAKEMKKETNEGTVTYTGSPMLVNFTLDRMHTVLELDAKYTVKPDEGDLPSKYSVTKYWNNETDASKRPESITVQIYTSEGELYKEVELNAENDWSYSWEDYAGLTWKVVEKDVPANYKVVYNFDGDTMYSIENNYEDSSSVPDSSSTPDSSQPTVTPPSTPSTPSGPIPQTGLLWWPVLVLSLVGITLVVVGVKLHSTAKKETNE